MPDTSLFGPDDRADDIEALLRELDTDDLELVAPPGDVWSGIEAALAGDTGGLVVQLDQRRSRFGHRFLAAAAAIAFLAAGAVVLTSLRDDGPPALATATLVHEADFDPLGVDAAATARLVERDGVYEIELVDASLPDPDANDLELWLIAAEGDGSLDVQPVSLVDPRSPGTYAVPAGLDPAVYSIVDISIEPRDGDEAHSGRSILRGTLDDV